MSAWLIALEIAVISCAGANGFATITLPGTPLAAGCGGVLLTRPPDIGLTVPCCPKGSSGGAGGVAPCSCPAQAYGVPAVPTTSDPPKRALDLAAFLARLQAYNITHSVDVFGPGNILVRVSVTGERWEVEFFPSAPPEVEVFRSTGEVCDSSALERLFEQFADRPT